MNIRLMQTGHHSTISGKRKLLHSVLEGRYIDVGHLTRKDVVDWALSKVRTTDARIKMKTDTLSSQVSGLKGLIQEVVAAPGVPPKHFAIALTTQLGPYFQNI
ncbi:hypothetical protein V6N12_042379 [Hibiscus sabdariffa]|uniref:Uncharacterized protein n=1 Tax=Hibiscus sabdariffa TaxID=183260 RepID=A0ABR2EF10_9ROSI